LVNLSIGLLGCDDFHPPNSGEVITASNLASWKVELSAGSDVMLNKLMLPSLVDLEVRECIPLENNSLEHLVSRSNCPLRKMSLTQALGVELDIIPLLRVTPLLEKLVFSEADSRGIRELLDILARTKLVNDISEDPNMMFLPHLENLSFIGVQDESPPWHVVPSLFPPTWHPANSQYRPLRRFEFRICTDLEVEHHLDKDVLLQLREIQQRDYDLIVVNEDVNTDVTDLIQASYDFHIGSRISSDNNWGLKTERRLMRREAMPEANTEIHRGCIMLDVGATLTTRMKYSQYLIQFMIPFLTLYPVIFKIFVYCLIPSTWTASIRKYIVYRLS